MDAGLLTILAPQKKVGKFVEVSGKFDVNVWYAYSNHSKTAVFSETVHYKDKVKLHFRDGDVSAGDDVRVRVIQEPNCIELSSLHAARNLKSLLSVK